MGDFSARVSAIHPQLGLPDLERLRELLERIQEILTIGGVALALAVSFLFILSWVLSHMRRPSNTRRPLLSHAALWSSYAPVGLTVLAAAGLFVPLLRFYMFKIFALAVLLAALSWGLAVLTLFLGGKRSDLSRARYALLLSGTPWYCLAVWISTYL